MNFNKKFLATYLLINAYLVGYIIAGVLSGMYHQIGFYLFWIFINVLVPILVLMALPRKGDVLSIKLVGIMSVIIIWLAFIGVVLNAQKIQKIDTIWWYWFGVNAFCEFIIYLCVIYLLFESCYKLRITSPEDYAEEYF